MKKVIVLLLFVSLCCLQLSAQQATRASAEPEEVTYNKALKYGDYEAAKNAIYMLMQKHPDNRSYLDSLAQLFFAMGEYPQCILAGTDFLQGKDTANATVMELVAIADGNLNRYKEALEIWDKLWKQSGNPQYAYQVAVHQYLIKRYGECAQTIDIILKDTTADKEKVSLSNDQNKSEKVAMKAAANNLMGVIFKELNKTDQAKASFEAALKISPDFDLAKSNLEEMNKKDAAKEDGQAKTSVPKKK